MDAEVPVQCKSHKAKKESCGFPPQGSSSCYLLLYTKTKSKQSTSNIIAQTCHSDEKLRLYCVYTVMIKTSADDKV